MMLDASSGLYLLPGKFDLRARWIFSYLLARYGEKIGRKKSVLLGTTIMSVGAILQITSFSLAQMFVGRVIAGIGNGEQTLSI